MAATGPCCWRCCCSIFSSPRRRQDWRLIPVALAGCLLDGLLWWLGLFHFSSVFPLWLVLLWCGFAPTLSHGLRWLRPLPRWQQGLFGMLGRQLYVAGPPWGQ